jgi:hypothetical protein
LLTFPSVGIVTDPEARLKLLNSASYFAAETMEIAGNLGVDADMPCSPDELGALVSELESSAPIEGPKGLQIWDSIAYARSMLSHEDKARHAASRVLVAHRDIISGPPAGLPIYFREQEAAAVARALAILDISDE